MEKVYAKEELKCKNIYMHGTKESPDSIELKEDRILVKKDTKSIEIPINSMRGKALLDRLYYDGELVQEIYL
ncbi:MAG: pantothenate kinase [Aquificaceae bacterium]